MRTSRLALISLFIFAFSSQAVAAIGAEETVKQVYKAAQASDLKKLRENLSDEALILYGSFAGMEALNKQAAPYRKIKASAELLSQSSNGKLRRYTAGVFGKTADKSLHPIATASISCSVHVETDTVCTPVGLHGEHCHPIHYRYENCFVTDLK